MAVTVTTHTKKLSNIFRHTNQSETSCCSRRVCTSLGASPSGSDSESNWYGWTKSLAHATTSVSSTLSLKLFAPSSGSQFGVANVANATLTQFFPTNWLLPRLLRLTKTKIPRKCKSIIPYQYDVFKETSSVGVCIFFKNTWFVYKKSYQYDLLLILNMKQ